MKKRDKLLINKYRCLLLVITGALCLVGCSKEDHYYAVYNSDPEYAKIGPDYQEDIESTFCLPLTTSQLESFKKENVDIYPHFFFKSYSSEEQRMPAIVFSDDMNGFEDFNRYETNINVFPYFNEDLLRKRLIKEYVGEYDDDDKEYVYIAEEILQMISHKTDDDMNYLNQLDKTFTNEIKIEMSCFVPVSGQEEDSLLYYNDDTYGPFNAFEYKYKEVQKTFYVKGILKHDDAINWFSILYRDYNVMIKEVDSNVQNRTTIIHSQSKKIEKKFEELGIVYVEIYN